MARGTTRRTLLGRAEARALGLALAVGLVGTTGCYGGAGVAIPPADVVAAAPQATEAEESADASESPEALEVRLLAALAEVAESSAARSPAEIRAALERALAARGCSLVDPVRETDLDELTIRLSRCAPYGESGGLVRVTFVRGGEAPERVEARVTIDGAELEGTTFDGDAIFALEGGTVALEHWNASARAAEGPPPFVPVDTSVSYVGPYKRGPIEEPFLRAVDGTFRLLFCLARVAALFG